MSNRLTKWLVNTSCSNCSDRNISKVLSQKPFCHSFWRWQHALLIDTVDRLGYPDFFLTMSASEWDLPKPWWNASRFQRHGLPPTQDSFAETISISHSLQQFVSAYFCGEGHGKWTDHLFANAKHRRKKNVKALFWRLEFQRRGTPHLHCLMWIDRVDALGRKRFSASMPQNHPVVAHNVLCYQRSSKPPLGIQMLSVPTHGKNGKIVYQRNKFDEQNNVRSYVNTIIMSLRSHMGVHCTDGYSMLLQYVSLYVTKMHNNFICSGSTVGSSRSPSAPPSLGRGRVVPPPP